jgi:hypothetical protein
MQIACQHYEERNAQNEPRISSVKCRLSPSAVGLSMQPSAHVFRRVIITAYFSITQRSIYDYKLRSNELKL